jgi:flagellar basal body-associated protein FliL
MSTVAPPLALATIGIIVIVVVLLVVAAGAYALLVRDNPRQAKVDAEREHVAEEFPLGNPVDFDSEFKPPPRP